MRHSSPQLLSTQDLPAEFRNPHYHLPSDTPDTLDYDFMTGVTKLALVRIIAVSDEADHH
jgi:hypothetical protein